MKNYRNEKDYCFWCGEMTILYDTDLVDLDGTSVRLCKNCKSGDDECDEYLGKLREKTN